MKQPSIFMGIPCVSGLFPANVAMSFMTLQRVGNGMVISHIERNRTDVSRNILAERFLSSECTHLFLCDDDGILPPDTLEKLLSDDKDIVMGAFVKRDGSNVICHHRREKKKAKNGEMVWDYTPIEHFDAKDGHLVEIDAGGMAATLIKREVVEKLSEKFNGKPFTSVYDPEQDSLYGDDVMFCQRAKDEGYKVWVDLRVRPGHLGFQNVHYFSDNLIK